MQPEARCLLLVLFVCIVNLSNIVGVPPPASAGRRCLSKADAKVRTFFRTRKLFGDFFVKKGFFEAFFDLGQGHGDGIHIIYICAREGWTSPAAELRGTGRKGAGRDGIGERGTGREETEDGGIEKSRDVSQHTALSLSRPIRSWTSRIAAFSQMYFRLRDDTHRLDVCKTTKTIKNIKDSISLSA